MKRLLLPLLVCCGLVLSAKEESVIRTLDNRDMKVSSIRALPDGSLEYTMADGKIKSTMPRGKYIYAWIPKPKEIAAADILLEANVPDKAAAAYRAAYEKYKLLGWDVYCIYRESEALARLGRRIEAVRKLDQLKDYKLINTRLVPLLVAVKRLNAQLNIDLGKYDSALALLNEMTMGTDDANAAFGFLKKGDILLRQGKKKEAALMYLQTVLLFRNVPERPEALYKLCTVLTETKDPNAAKFASMLKREYPDSSYTKILFPEKK